MDSLQKNVTLLLLAGMALCLLQIWLPSYYLTGDGPCHLYNAQIVHDMWVGANRQLYDRFYTLTYRPDPNWLTTFALASLLFIAKGAVAEKIFLTVYLVVYTTGFYVLLKKISGGGNTGYWPLVIFIFIFPLTLAKGFYNYSFSIAFYFWLVWCWLRFLERKSTVSAVLFFLCAGLLFFTHLLPFVFGAFTCGALIASHALATPRGRLAARPASFFAAYTAWLFVFLLPFLVLMVWFTQKEGGLQLHIAPHPYRLLELVQFKYIITLTEAEKLPSAIAGVTITILTIVTFFRSVKNFVVHKYDGMVVGLLFVGLVYVFFPEDFLGRAIIISFRTQLFVFLLCIFCIAYRLPEGNIKYAGAFIVFLCFGWLSAERIHCRANAAKALKDYLFAGNLITKGAVVLPLNFSLEGQDENGKVIADRNSIFHHAADYLGVEQPLIVLNNYEANIGYFPVNWQEHINPYTYLSRGAGIEGVPPYAKPDAYLQATGIRIDYILLWCYRPAFLADRDFASLYTEICSTYHQVYISPTGRTILLQHN